MSGGLGKAGVSAMKWGALSTTCRFGLQLLAQVFLARLLGPENYGVFGIAMIVLTLSSFLSNFGFAWNLLHRQNMSPEDIRFAFTWTVLVGLVTGIAVYFSAPWVADYFNQPRSKPVIEWLSLTCVFGAGTSTANTLLQKNLKFRASGLIGVSCYALGYIFTGIPMALMGFGVYALVAAMLVQSFSSMVANLVVSPHPVRPLFFFEGAKSAFNTGGIVFLTNIVNWSITNVDRILIGRLLNTHAVGVYTVAYNLATTPNSLLLGALQTSFMAAASKMSSERERLQSAYLEIVSATWTLLLPIFAIMAVLASDLVRVIYGEKWIDTGWPLAILFMGMPAYICWGVSTPILWNTQRKRHEFMLQIPVLIIGACLLYAVVPQGIFWAASCATMLMYIRMAVITGAALKALDMKAAVLLKPLSTGALLALMTGSAAWVGSVIFQGKGYPLAALLVGGGASAATYLGVLLVWPGLLGEPSRKILGRFMPRLVKR